MTDKYKRADISEMTLTREQAREIINDENMFVPVKVLCELLDVNMVDKYFAKVVSVRPSYGVESLLQFGCIPVLDYRKLTEHGAKMDGGDDVTG